MLPDCTRIRQARSAHHFCQAVPEPLRKIVGDLSNTERASLGLQLERVEA
jgi:hypothetical protein